MPKSGRWLPGSRTAGPGQAAQKQFQLSDPAWAPLLTRLSNVPKSVQMAATDSSGLSALNLVAQAMMTEIGLNVVFQAMAIGAPA
jgi:hypothetical protein